MISNMTSHSQIHTEWYKASCAKCEKNVMKTNRTFLTLYNKNQQDELFTFNLFQ